MKYWRYCASFILFSFPLLAVFLFAGTTPAAAQSTSPMQVTPSFYPLAPCPTCTNPNLSPVVSGVVPVTSGYNPGSQNPTVSEAPCDDSTIASDNAKKKSKHKKHKGAVSNGMEQILKLLIDLINKLLELLGGGKVDSPSTPSTPSEPKEPQGEQPMPSTALPTVGTPNEQPTTTEPNPCVPQNEPSESPQGGQPMPSSGPAVSSAVPSTAVPSGGAAPSGVAQAIDLTNWYLGLPTGAAESPTNIKQPQLNSFTVDPWFIKNPGGGLRFRAAVNGVTTSGSDYPRSELREMKGSAEASWSSSTGTHTMTIDEAITAVPKTKKHIVAGQIHDSSSDVIVIRLEMPKLMVDVGGTEGAVLDANYTLGKRFQVKFEVTGGKTNVYYNGSTTPAHTISTSYSGAYFKAGAYTQSNCSKEASSDCNENNYGEVIIYGLTVTHN